MHSADCPCGNVGMHFAPYVEACFASKAKTIECYRIGRKNLREFAPLANWLLDAIPGDKLAAFISKRRQAGRVVASINRFGNWRSCGEC